MYEIIPDKLATHGIGDDNLVQPPEQARHNELIHFNDKNWVILDARILDDEGNSEQYVYEYLIDYGIRMLKQHKLVVVCCGAGQSRSNAIALGILIQNFNMEFYSAWDLIRDRVPIAQIMPYHISILKKIFGVTLP